MCNGRAVQAVLQSRYIHQATTGRLTALAMMVKMPVGARALKGLRSVQSSSSRASSAGNSG
jgi:hypothetical protein